MYQYRLTLTVNLTTYDKPINPELAVALNRVLGDWGDGRYSFDVEMMIEGLYRSMKQAAYQVNQKAMYEKYGNEMVPHEDGKGATSKAYLEAQKMPIDVPYMHDTFSAKIERVSAKRDDIANGAKPMTRKEIAAMLTNNPEERRILGMSDEELMA